MKGMFKKSLLLGATAMMLTGCMSNNFVKDLLQTTADIGYCVQLPRGDSQLISAPLHDTGHYNKEGTQVIYSFTFNREQKTEWYTLSGEFAGKTVASAVYEDEHTVYLTFGGTSTTGSTGTVYGTLTINQAAFARVDDEYKGATVLVTIALGDQAGKAVKPSNL